jgi:xanthine dehydrogenase accessory factor
VTPEQRARVHTPAGLDIGARTPAEIALSVYAQLVASRVAVPASPAIEPDCCH